MGIQGRFEGYRAIKHVGRIHMPYGESVRSRCDHSEISWKWSFLFIVTLCSS